jgi:hypothetical protein
MCIHAGIKDGRYDVRGNLVPGTGHYVYLYGRRITGEGAWHASTGNGYFNGMQFLLSTWQSVRGDPRWDRDPAGAPPLEQLHRAYLVWLRDGRSWREWGTTRIAFGLH